MSDIAIRVNHLAKLYRLGQKQEGYKTLRDSLSDTLAAPFRKLGGMWRGQSAHDEAEDMWALRDVCFEVKQGEVIGVIGRNGAGKSTLLKVLSRITEPTRGQVDIYGRIGALLEVGSGFHPELTGRENIFLNGAILGMRRAEIRRKFDEIVAFAEVERFIDTPVKRYSSGMYLRLAFAVAAHLEPEILIVDEVLAVGDAEFQKRCLGRMKDISEKQGRAVLFVSHNLNAVRSLCSRAILLEKGSIIIDNNVETVLDAYLKKTRKTTPLAECKTFGDTARLYSVRLVDANLNEIESVSCDCKVGIAVNFEITNGRYNPDIWLAVYTAEGMLVFGSGIDRQKADYSHGKKCIVCWISANLLNSVSYSVRVTCLDLEKHITFFDLHDALCFDVVEDMNERTTSYRGPWYGATRPQLDWGYLSTLIQ